MADLVPSKVYVVMGGDEWRSKVNMRVFATRDAAFSDCQNGRTYSVFEVIENPAVCTNCGQAMPALRT